MPVYVGNTGQSRNQRRVGITVEARHEGGRCGMVYGAIGVNTDKCYRDGIEQLILYQYTVGLCGQAHQRQAK